MKKLMMIIAVLGIVAFLGNSASTAFTTVDTEISVNIDNQDLPDEGKCKICGKENCDGKCKNVEGKKVNKTTPCKDKPKTSCCKPTKSCNKTKTTK